MDEHGSGLGDRPGAVSGSPARVARGDRDCPWWVSCAVVGILGTTACAAELGRGESALGSAAAEPVRPGQVFRDCEVCPEMVVVPEGSYLMGSPASEGGRYYNEGPRHRVTIAHSLA